MDFVFPKESSGIGCFTFSKKLTARYPTVWVGELLKIIPVSFSSLASSSKSRS